MHVKILVTGGAGFLGSHLVELLLQLGHSVTVVDNLSTGFAHYVPQPAQLIVHDIRDPLESIFHENRPEVVIHLAAQVSVPHSITDPAEDASVNITGYINVLQTAARFGVCKVIMISSAAVYGTPQVLPLTEDSALAPQSPYGLSKMVGEHYTRLLCKQYGMAYTILRPANIYGPRQQTEGDGAVVPTFLQCFAVGRDPIIHGDGNQTRDFIYVEDMARAIVASLKAGDNRTFNVGSGVSVSIRDLWHRLADLVGWQREPLFGPERPGDIKHSVMDSTEAIRTLGWKPCVDLSHGLARTVEWWQSR